MAFLTTWGPIFKDWAPVVAVVLTFVNLLFLTLQVHRQNVLSKAQLLRDRYDMYSKVYKSISEDDLKMVDISPGDYMPLDVYDKIKGKPDLLKKYMLMSELVEFLAFTFELRYYGIKDTFGPDWVKLWTKDLKSRPEFMTIVQYYANYYPKYSQFVEDL